MQSPMEMQTMSVRAFPSPSTAFRMQSPEHELCAFPSQSSAISWGARPISPT